MILVVLGTEKYQFTRVLERLENYISEFQIMESVVVQAGFTKYESSRMKVISFLSAIELDELYKNARIVIAHGGTGSVVKGVKLKKSVVVIPRLKKYGEHIDDHQLELAIAFSKAGYATPWMDTDDLAQIMMRAGQFIPKDFRSGRDAILSFVESYIDSL